MGVNFKGGAIGKFEGKKAIITGGDSGIGRAVALAFAREGADVAINFITGDEMDAQETKRMVEETGRGAILVEGDVGDKERVKNVMHPQRERSMPSRNQWQSISLIGGYSLMR